MANARKSLSLYAERAGISKEAAQKRLARLGINYTQPFDFDDADRRFTEARHASRVAFSKSALKCLVFHSNTYDTIALMFDSYFFLPQQEEGLCADRKP